MTFTNKNAIESLKNIGISETQYKIYLCILQLGIATVLHIAKETKINRQQIYNDTEKMLELGLIELTNKNKKRFIASPPEKILTIYEERSTQLLNLNKDLQDLVESIRGLRRKRKIYNNVTVFDGTTKIKQAYEQELILAKNTVVLSIVGNLQSHFNEIDEKYWHKWNQTFIKNKSSSKMIIESRHSYTSSDKEHERETKILESLKMESNIDIWDNYVLIVSPKENIGILIESPIVSHSYKMIFNTLWSISKSL